MALWLGYSVQQTLRVLSQFTPEAGHPCLADYIDQPDSTLPAG